jgi:hypothetical protein
MNYLIYLLEIIVFTLIIFLCDTGVIVEMNILLPGLYWQIKEKKDEEIN